MTLYNEIDPFAADWLERLIEAGHISPGRVERKSIKELSGADLEGFNRVHLFAGIAGWDYALQLAGWPADRPVWTGSCPCQPFSSAGKRKGQADERHLWPDMFRLIRERRPDTVFGEQVASAIGHGWLDGVFADLEGIGYTCGAVVLGAHSVGAPHMRQRLWWVASRLMGNTDSQQTDSAKQRQSVLGEGCDGVLRRLGDRESKLRERSGQARTGRGGLTDGRGMGITTSDGPQGIVEAGPACGAVERARDVCGVEYCEVNGLQEHNQERSVAGIRRSDGWWTNNFIPCGDGKTRRLEPGLSPLVDGVPGRVVRLRGYGNAIVPQVAAEFIRSFMEAQ